MSWCQNIPTLSYRSALKYRGKEKGSVGEENEKNAAVDEIRDGLNRGENTSVKE